MKKTFLLFLWVSFSVNAQLSDFKNINFKKADSIAIIYKNASLKSLPKLVYQLTENLKTDVEKFSALFIWICKNIEGDYHAYSKNHRKRNRYKNNPKKLDSWNKAFNKRVFKKLLNDKKTVCTGYAYLLKEMCFYANLECEIIDGFGRNSSSNIGELSMPNHSWNAVKLNTKWYLADATWASGSTDLNTNSFVFDYNEGYFLTEPKWFFKNHFPLDKNWLLINKNKPTTDQFINSVLVYGITFKYGIYPISPDKMKNEIIKNDTVNFTLETLNEVTKEDFTFMVGTNSKSKNINTKDIFISKKNIEIRYKFKNKGLYDFHILYKNQVVCTYIFKIK